MNLDKNLKSDRLLIEQGQTLNGIALLRASSESQGPIVRAKKSQQSWAIGGERNFTKAEIK